MADPRKTAKIKETPHFESIPNGSPCKGGSGILHMMIQPQTDFCCFRLVAINIALTHCFKLVSFFKFNFCCFLLLVRFVPNVAKDEYMRPL